jgi:hypothetical protein
MMRTGFGSGNWDKQSIPHGSSYPGMMPEAPAASGDASSGSDTGAGGTDAGVGYRNGGSVRKRKARPPSAARPAGNRAHRRRVRQGYAGGGSVNPLLMSVSLDSRSKNPAHAAEDREPLATRPGGSPNAPEEYRRGGEVEDDEEDEEIPQEEWVEPPMTPDAPEEPDEPDPEDRDEPLEGEARERPPEGEAPEGEAPEQPLEGEAPEGGVPPEGEADPEGGGAGGGGGGGGGGGQPMATGYGQPKLPGEEEAGETPDTGYGPQAAQNPESNPLKEVLDYTRAQLGVGTKSTPESTQGLAPTQTAAAEAPAPTNTPIPVGQPSGMSGTPGEESAETSIQQPVPPTQTAGVPEAPARMPASPGAAAAPPQPSGTASGPGNAQAIQDYVSGKGGLSQEQMTELLDRTNQANPNLGQDGAIHQAFKDLTDKKDYDTASKFVQALRPSYDSVRALMIAAASEGQFDKAMQLAERMNNLIPNGDKVRFGQTPDGMIIAQVQPEDGGPSTRHTLTPDQFAKFANSPLSLFDHIADQGLNQNLSMLTGQQGQQGSSASAAGTQYAQAQPPVTGGGGRATMTDAGTQPTTGYNPQALGTKGGQILEQAGVKDPGAGAIPRPTRTAQAAPASGAAPGSLLSRVPLPVAGRDYSTTQPPRTGYNGGQGGLPQVTIGGRPQGQRQPEQSLGLTPMELYNARLQAWNSFKMDNQLTQRGNMEKQIIGQMMRDKARQQTNQFRQTPADRMAQEGLKQSGANYRAELVAQSNRFKTLVSSDLGLTRTIMGRQNTAERNAFSELTQRMRNHAMDPVNGRKPFPYTEQDRAILKNAAGTALNNNILNFDNYQPGGGVIRQQPQAAPQGAQPAAPAPATPSMDTKAPIEKPTPASPKAPDLETYRGATPPPDWQIPPGWVWGSSSSGKWSARPAPPPKPAAPSTPMSR